MQNKWHLENCVLILFLMEKEAPSCQKMSTFTGEDVLILFLMEKEAPLK